MYFLSQRNVSSISLEHIYGFILNITSPYKFGMIKIPMYRKHWIAIRKIGLTYYNLDSKLQQPESIGNEENVLQYLSDQINCGDREILIVVTTEVSQSGAWSKTFLTNSSKLEQENSNLFGSK